MDPALPSPGDARTWVLQLFGVPVVAILTINALLVLAEWLRVAVGAGRATSTVGRWVVSVSRDGWSAAGPARRGAVTFVALAAGQAVAVALLYLTCRMLYALPVAIQPSDVPAADVWSAFVESVVAAPTEDPPWTLYAFLVALAIVGTFDASLILRAKYVHVVSRAVITALAFPLWAVTLVVGGLCLVVLVVIGVLLFAAALSGGGMSLAWPLGLALGAATGGAAYLTMLSGGYFSLRMEDLLDPDEELRLRRPDDRRDVPWQSRW